jgi:cob(I)alamin adenosyltransferase
MSIVTGTGDDGRSSLFGGARVPKHHPRLEAYGTIDEAQSAIGMIRATGSIPDNLESLLRHVQEDLFVIGSDLASPDAETSVPRVTSGMIKSIHDEIHRLEKSLPEIKKFIIPAGTPAAATCFWARTIVRRAERHVAELLTDGQDVSSILVYLNRLGDLLFLVARRINLESGMQEELHT